MVLPASATSVVVDVYARMPQGLLIAPELPPLSRPSQESDLDSIRENTLEPEFSADYVAFINAILEEVRGVIEGVMDVVDGIFQHEPQADPWQHTDFSLSVKTLQQQVEQVRGYCKEVKALLDESEEESACFNHQRRAYTNLAAEWLASVIGLGLDSVSSFSSLLAPAEQTRASNISYGFFLASTAFSVLKGYVWKKWLTYQKTAERLKHCLFEGSRTLSHGKRYIRLLAALESGRKEGGISSPYALQHIVHGVRSRCQQPVQDQTLRSITESASEQVVSTESGEPPVEMRVTKRRSLIANLRHRHPHVSRYTTVKPEIARSYISYLNARITQIKSTVEGMMKTVDQCFDETEAWRETSFGVTLRALRTQVVAVEGLYQRVQSLLDRDRKDNNLLCCNKRRVYAYFNLAAEWSVSGLALTLDALGSYTDLFDAATNAKLQRIAYILQVSARVVSIAKAVVWKRWMEHLQLIEELVEFLKQSEDVLKHANRYIQLLTALEQMRMSTHASTDDVFLDAVLKTAKKARAERISSFIVRQRSTSTSEGERSHSSSSITESEVDDQAKYRLRAPQGLAVFSSGQPWAVC